jgi:hypothetical protein
MTDPKPGKKPQEPSAPHRPPTPKRGAFPTPKEELEKATPYVPEAGEANEEENEEENPAFPPKKEKKKED